MYLINHQAELITVQNTFEQRQLTNRFKLREIY